MNYEQRMIAIRPWVGDMLARYDRPAHLVHAKAEAEIRDMAEDLNSEIPSNVTSEVMAGILERTARQIRKRQRTRTWPTINLVISAARDSLPASLEPVAQAPESLRADLSMRIQARRIKAKEPVGESWISGRDADRLVDAKLITRQDLAPYLAAIAARPVETQQPVEDSDDLESIEW